MQTIQIRSFAARQSHDTRQSKTLGVLASFCSAVAEGVSKAEQYETLTHKSSSELAVLGLRREDLPRLAMFGKA